MDQLMQAPSSLCTTKAGMSAGTTTTLTTANTQLFSLKGKGFSKAGVSNEATPTTDAVTGAAFLPIPVNKGGVFTICRDASGNLKVIQGSIVDLDASGAFGPTLPQFGPMLDTLAAIGYILVKVGPTGSAWTFGSSNLAGPPTGVVFTFVDVFSLPDRPQAS